MGPDGHVASIFPEHPSSYAEGDVIGVRASPKPPPERISLTLPVINRSHEVWFVVSGADKAAAAKMALLGAGPVQVPAAGVSGRERTLWLLDRDAAAELPADSAQQRATNRRGVQLQISCERRESRRPLVLADDVAGRMRTAPSDPSCERRIEVGAEVSSRATTRTALERDSQ